MGCPDKGGMIRKNGQVWLTPREAAVRYLLSLSTIYHWCSQGLVITRTPKELGARAPTKYLIEEESLRARRREAYAD